MFYPSRARPIISAQDFENIRALAASQSPEAAHHFERAVAHFLVSTKPTLQMVTAGLGSAISFMDSSTGVTKRVKLVGPDEADGEHAAISVLSPLGLALLGLSPRDLIQWQLSPQVRRTLEIVKVEPADNTQGAVVDTLASC